MTLLNKIVENSIKQSKLLARMSEISCRSWNGTRQTRSSFTKNDLKEQPITDIPAVGGLTSEMINPCKREEEEQNRYVDAAGNEFRFAPAGAIPTLNAPALVDVPSLSGPAKITDVQKVETNFSKKFRRY